MLFLDNRLNSHLIRPKIGYGRRTFLTLSALALSLVSAGCSGSPNETTETPNQAIESTGTDQQVGSLPEQSGQVGDTSTSSSPQRGGTLDIGVYAQVLTLDPAKAPTDGTVGGIELTAIYDTLMRYVPGGDKYVPQLAKSLEHGDNYQTWTLHLRPEVKFSDGTPVNAKAVIYSISRVRELGARFQAETAKIERMTAPDKQTVVFHLETSWARFPYVLASGPGRIVSPSAVRKLGEDGFAKSPVGAGPFMLDTFRDQEELVLKANPDYWGGRPYLDKLRFVPLSGGQRRLDTLNAKGIQMAFLRNAEIVAEALEDGHSGSLTIVNTNDVLSINHASGRPGADARVRKALAYAIDPVGIYERTTAGKGYPGKAVFGKSSPWHTTTKPLPHDSAKARQLLEAAKDDGYDGELVLTCSNDQRRQEEAVALEAQLEAAGFEVKIDLLQIGAVIRQLTEKTYDIACAGNAVVNAAPWPLLASNLVSNSPQNESQYSNEQMEGLLQKLSTAPGRSSKLQVLSRIQALWNATVPYVPIAAVPEFVVWGEDVHGVKPGIYGTVVLSDAWLSS